MDQNSNHQDICCQKTVQVDALDDFCIQEHCCPKKIKQPKFSSPSSCLPEDKIDNLNVKIAEINQFLLDLALSEKRTPNEVFKRAFDGLVGQVVKVILNCPKITNPLKDCKAVGRVFLVGKDFVLIMGEKSEILISFDKIKKIKLSNRFADRLDGARLINIEPCFRKNVTFNFGETVASSPELIQVFFRLALREYLLLLQGKKVKIIIEGKKIIGRLFEIHGDTITLRKKDKTIEIPLEKLCKLVVLKK